MTRHLDARELAELDASPPDDARHAHVRDCARCRALVSAWRSYQDPTGVPPGARLREAEDALATFLAREVEGVRPAPARRASWLEALFAPALRPAWALAGLAIVAGGVWLAVRPESPEPIVLRGAPSAPVGGGDMELLAPERDGDLVTLSWRPAKEADAYEVRLYSDDLVEIARIAPGPDTFAVLRPRQIARGVRPGATLHWRVVALGGGDEVGGSGLGELKAP